jgi:hypothetical protein
LSMPIFSTTAASTSQQPFFWCIAQGNTGSLVFRRSPHYAAIAVRSFRCGA